MTLPLQTVLHSREGTSLVSINSLHCEDLSTHPGQLTHVDTVRRAKELRSVIIYVCHPEMW